ncbi:MAG: TRAP transporter small permease [Synergistaceae bacterium]|jgi:TRAP-type C4-dicarboxylate transport system permease small subunit|nr:TRAP transporter small permease [Synergistaceae bacterium]
MKIVTKILTWLSQAINLVSFFCFLAIIIFIVLDVTLRVALDKPILGSYEIVEQLMLCGVFCSFAYAQMKGSHVHITMLLTRLPRKVAIFIFALGEFLSCAGAALLSWALYQQVKLEFARHYTTSILKFSTTPSRIIITVASIMLTITLLLSAIKSVTAMFSKEMEAEVTQDWI